MGQSSRKVIVTTTINPPTEAIRRFDQHDDFTLVVIGDRKTPPDYRLDRGLYVSPDEQQARFPRLSALLGWNCIQRRNIGFLIALEMGAEIVATVDDDNVPYPHWGKNLLIGEQTSVKSYVCNALVFDPVGRTNYPHLWHRGFPLQLVHSRQYGEAAITNETVRVQADFWDGDPDVDAACRMIFAPLCRFDPKLFPFTSAAFAPFNSQNTFLDARLLPHYFMFPGVGRMDDIWGAYYLQAATGVRPIFCAPSVEQQRNIHDLTRDFAREVDGYKKTLSLVGSVAHQADDIFGYLPGHAVGAFLEYRAAASEIVSRRQDSPSARRRKEGVPYADGDN